MSNSSNSFLILDIGSAWTKAFVVSVGEKSLIKAFLKLPTSAEDLRFSTKLLIDKLGSKAKGAKILITSTYDEASVLEKAFGAVFVSKEKINKSLAEWFPKQGFENPIILDGGASNYLKNLRAADIGSYLSFSISEKTLENFMGNKSFRLATISEDKKELEIDEAVLRSAFGTISDLHNPNKFNTLLLTGGIFSWSPKTTRHALVLLDLLASGKVVQVFQDKEGLLNSFGAAMDQEKDFKQSESFLRNLGSLVSLGGGGKVHLDYGLSDIQEVTVADSEIAMIPADKTQKIKITLFTEPKLEFNVYGGEWGVVLDGRPKPLPVQFGDQRTRQAIATWQKALEKVEVLDI